MNIPPDLLLYATGSVVGLISWIAKREFSKLNVTQKEILNEVRRTNGRLLVVETRIEDHTHNDEERFRSVNDRIGELSERLRRA